MHDCKVEEKGKNKMHLPMLSQHFAEPAFAGVTSVTL